MNISIIGFGYIGAVIGAVLSNLGNKIVAIDNNSNCIEKLNLGISNVPEPSLRALVKKGVKNGTLSGSLGYESVADSEVILVTVGTPLSNQFDADLDAIRSVFFNLANHVKSGQIIMVKSTVPPGVTRQMAEEYFGDRDDIYVGFSP
ncbi:MAG: nucleotide sugar dehydrogenase, partial [Flavobacteriaceae bacterium]|nr:nucleotide sugar dehydrogenase [Flavobacteriaceae bacterium]